MNRFYFRVMDKKNLRYFYCKTLPKNIITNKQFWVQKLNEPVQIIEITKSKKKI